MARQGGLLKVVGKLDDLSFYKSADGFLVRTKGGVSADRIANDPTFQRTRENGAEFGMSASAGKLLRTALRNLMMTASDNRVVSRLTRLMTDVKNLDAANERGERHVHEGFDLPEGKALLKGFNFNNRAILSGILFKSYALNTTTGALDITGLVPMMDVVSAPGATHLTIKAGWSKVALLAWLNAHGGAAATDACDNNLTWSHNYNGVSNGCGATGATTVIFTVSDACGNTNTTSATFTIEDTTNPTITAPADISLSCGNGSNEATVQTWLQSYVANDNCGDVTVTNDYTAIPTTCVAGSNTVTVTFTVTDACNRTSTDQAIITMTDNVKPVIMTSPQDLIVECTDANRATLIANWAAAYGGATAIDNCDNSQILAPSSCMQLYQCHLV